MNSESNFPSAISEAACRSALPVFLVKQPCLHVGLGAAFLHQSEHADEVALGPEAEILKFCEARTVNIP